MGITGIINEEAFEIFNYGIVGGFYWNEFYIIELIMGLRL